MRQGGVVLTLVLMLGPFASAAPAAAGHDVFHIFTPAVEADHWGVEALSTFQDVAGDHDDGDDETEAREHGHAHPRAAHEIAVHGGITSFWMTKIAFAFARESGESYTATTIASENVFRLPGRGDGPIDVAWFTALEAGLESGGTNAVVFGPIVTYSAGPFSLTLNPFLEQTFGRNREDGIAFTYGWRMTYSVTDTLGIGIEGYGEVENIASPPTADEQVHRLGPMLYLGHIHGAARSAHNHEAEEHGHGGVHTRGTHVFGNEHQAEWQSEVGVLFGLTSATPDVALKLNIGADF